MAGKLILFFLLAMSLATAYVIYGAFKLSPDYKALATEQMGMEFSNYTQVAQKNSIVTVATLNNQNYTIDLKAKWKFIIHDKTLLVQISPLTPMPSEADKASVEQQARTAVEGFLKTWLEDKYHTKKDLLVEVHFDEIQ